MKLVNHFHVGVLTLIGCIAVTVHAAPGPDAPFGEVRERADQAFEELERTLTPPKTNSGKDSPSVSGKSESKDIGVDQSKEASRENTSQRLASQPKNRNQDLTPPRKSTRLAPTWDPSVDPGFEGNEPVWDPAVDPELDAGQASWDRAIDQDPQSLNMQASTTGDDHGTEEASPEAAIFLDLMPIEERTVSKAAVPRMNRGSIIVAAPHSGTFLESVAQHFVSAAIGELMTGQGASRINRQNRARRRKVRRAQRTRKQMRRRAREERRRRNKDKRRRWL